VKQLQATKRRDWVGVSLIWPGDFIERRGGFGTPQLLLLAEALRAQGDADVRVVVLDLEAALGPALSVSAV
jgi:hypothetical protein